MAASVGLKPSADDDKLSATSATLNECQEGGEAPALPDLARGSTAWVGSAGDLDVLEQSDTKSEAYEFRSVIQAELLHQARSVRVDGFG